MGSAVLNIDLTHTSSAMSAVGNSAPAVRVSLVATERDLAAAMAVRSVVWLADPEQTFNVQFDPNDFGSSHVLAWVGDEPVGTLRIRWFAGFARFERMAIRPQFRSFKVFRALVGFSLDLCAAKGYAHVVGVSRPPGVSFWKRCGGEVIGDGPIIYNGMEVYPMRMMLKKGVDERLASGIAGVGGSAFEAAIAVAEGELVASAPVPSKATQADDGIKRDREAA